ncbi:MAG: HEAT repeat domain-containing protein [Lachnospiraceae bacterium]|nr:HEAT repeat domain-containing protein [Lachnospiraceae bacterium]
MSNQKVLDKIAKAASKKKSGVIIGLMGKADNETLVAAIKALSEIGDEDSCNHITHYLDHEDGAVRVAACKAGLKINTEYMRTRVRHQLAMEKDASIKAEIQKAFNEARA